MSVHGAKCPHCDCIGYFNVLTLPHIKRFGWVNCHNCGLFLKIILDKPGTNDVSKFEKYDSPIYFGEFCSERLNTEFSYSEPPMPEAICVELKKIMIGIQANLQPHPTNKNIKLFKSINSEKWVVENLLPKIIPIFNAYPFQVHQIMDCLILGSLLDPYMEKCEYCGLNIPKLKQNSCPICLNGKTPPPPEEQQG